MSTQTITYNLNQQFTLSLDYTAVAISKVLALEVLLESLPLTLYISLAELKNRILNRSSKRKPKISKLADLVKVLELVIQRIAKQCALKLSLINAEFIASTSSSCQLQLFRASNDLAGVVYLAKSSEHNLTTVLDQLHQAFMLKFSRALNHPLVFPVIIGEARISRQEFSGLRPGNLLIFDRLSLPQSTFSCQINNLRAEIEIID